MRHTRQARRADNGGLRGFGGPHPVGEFRCCGGALLRCGAGLGVTARLLGVVAFDGEGRGAGEERLPRVREANTAMDCPNKTRRSSSAPLSGDRGLLCEGRLI
ncbi:hypothetical protein [Saccharothrix texasensis]|uniref:Uncharacterized protein n=1 Tax=Saccharothrix texasensis TaxID=103734 RepID=A0A3N1HH26_9PSEU|nr:hypothetical protein [Saccharothrix texasensis]ROP41774.1 hypothetical protein EDD40_7217 [Saccharothrix texasensis]